MTGGHNQCLAIQPEVRLFDDPTSALDPSIRGLFPAKLGQLVARECGRLSSLLFDGRIGSASRVVPMPA
jgi:ABC-type histidine transport system ATPase subunit